MRINKMKHIPIIVSTDNNYKCLLVMLTSLLTHRRRDTYYEVYVFVDKDFLPESKEDLLDFASDYREVCDIRFVLVGEAFKEAQIHIKGITMPTFYRLLAPQLLKEDRCIYLDTDTLVLDDLSQMLDLLNEEHYIAGVKAIAYIIDNKNDPAYCKQAMLPDICQYINAGVLVMNLKKMREDNLVERFLELVPMHMRGQDQDIINSVCYGKITFLPFSWNVMTKYSDWKIEDYEKVFSKEEICEAWNNPKIIHYANPFGKPWKDLECAMGDLWWETCRRSPAWEYYYHELQSLVFIKALYQNKKNAEYRKGVGSPFSLSFPRDYVIYGAGKRAADVVTYLRGNNIEPCYILVSDKRNLKTAIQDIDIFELSEKKDDLHDKTIVVATREALQKEIIQSLFYVEYKELIPISDGWMNS